MSTIEWDQKIDSILSAFGLTGERRDIAADTLKESKDFAETKRLWEQGAIASDRLLTMHVVRPLQAAGIMP